MLIEVLSPETPAYNYNITQQLPQIPLVTPLQEPLTFRHTIDIYLKDSNAYGNTYFARYFEWQGICRERWFQQCVAEDLLQKEGVLITKNAHLDYVRETFPFQKVECQLNTRDVKQCSYTFVFRFVVGGAVVATGHQQIVFASHKKRIQRFPADVLDKIRLYEIPAEKPNNSLFH